MTVNLGMSSELDFNPEREVEQLRIAIEFHEQQIGRLASKIRELKEEQEGDYIWTKKEVDTEELEKLFEVEEKFPPQAHLDELERKLDFNFGEVDGFATLEWQSKCDLARVAVDNDFSIEECETILDFRTQAGDNSC